MVLIRICCFPSLEEEVWSRSKVLLKITTVIVRKQFL
jgi:hypothetical protein